MKHDEDRFSMGGFSFKNEIKLLYEISNKCMQFGARFYLNLFFLPYINNQLNWKTDKYYSNAFDIMLIYFI